MAKFVNRARDVAMLLDKHGFELGTRKAMLKLAEDNEMLRQEVHDLTQALGGLLSLTKNMGFAVAAHQKAMEQIEKKFHPNNEANPDQSWEQ